MIHFDEAIHLLEQNPPDLSQSLKIPVSDSLKTYLAEDIYAPINLPPFDNSAVDGFAISTEHEGLSRTLQPKIIAAGGQEIPVLKRHCAMKVMTGAPLPQFANAVIMQEEVRIDGNTILLSRSPTPHENVRFMGRDVEKGQRIARQNEQVTPSLIGLLLGCGINFVSVKKPLKVAIISSGDELVPPGQPLLFGQSYALVGSMLKALCDEAGFSTMFQRYVPDCPNSLLNALDDARDADLFLLTGGMSKGDYDFSRKALDAFNVKEIFHRGLWRPGKPLFFGIKNQQHFFGLPGNPVAVFVGFKIFVQSWYHSALGIRLLSDLPFSFMTADFSKPRGFTFFARARVSKNGAEVFHGQASHELYSLARANALLWLSPDSSVVKTGERVRYIPF